MQAEFSVPGPKCVQKAALPAPPPRLTVAALNVKTIPDASGKAQEIVIASFVHTTVRADAPASMDEWRACRNMKRVTIVRHLEGAAWPPGLLQAVKVRCAAWTVGRFQTSWHDINMEKLAGGAAMIMAHFKLAASCH